MSTATAALTQETYLPEQSAGEELAKVHDFIEALEKSRGERPAPRYFLAGSEPGEQVELPAEIYRILHHVVDALQAGLAVTIAPVSQTLTTQQAADLLGISRPTLVKYLDTGRIPHSKAGAHRRVLLSDVLAFQEERREQQHAAIAATSLAADDEDDLDEMLISLRAVRKATAERRRNQRP